MSGSVLFGPARGWAGLARPHEAACAPPRGWRRVVVVVVAAAGGTERPRPAGEPPGTGAVGPGRRGQAGPAGGGGSGTTGPGGLLFAALREGSGLPAH